MKTNYWRESEDNKNLIIKDLHDEQNLTKKLNNNNENFDIKSYFSSKTNNWKWKPLFIIYNSLIDQQEFFDSQSNELINELAKINKTITLEKIKNFKIEYNHNILLTIFIKAFIF